MLKLIVDDLSGVDESARSFYEKGEDGKFKLKVDGVPDTAPLLAKNQELLDEVKATKRKLRDMETEQERKIREAAAQNGDFKTLFEQTQAQLEAAKQEQQTLKSRIEAADIEAAVDGVVSSLTKDTQRAKALKKLAAPLAEYAGDKVVFKLAGVASSTDAVAAYIKNEYPFLVDGSSASGAGASGNGGGASGQPTTMSRAEFDKLPAARKSELSRKGITLTE